MSKCENCKFITENKFNCDKILGYKPSCEYFYNGALYARHDIENKDGNCKYYSFSILKYISSKFKKELSSQI